MYLTFLRNIRHYRMLVYNTLIVYEKLWEFYFWNCYIQTSYCFTHQFLRSMIACNIYNAYSNLSDNESQSNTLNGDTFKKKVLQVFFANHLLNEQLPYVILQCLKVTANSCQYVKNPQTLETKCSCSVR